MTDAEALYVVIGGIMGAGIFGLCVMAALMIDDKL